MFKERFITGVVLVVTVLLGLLVLPPSVFAILSLLIIVGIGSLEWAILVGYRSIRERVLAVLIPLLIASLLLLFHSPVLPVIVMSTGVVIWLGIIGLLLNYRQHTRFYRDYRWLLPVLGLFIPTIAWYGLVHLDALHYRYVIYVVGLVAVADTGAYLIGKRFGRVKLAPELSPGKTREGAWGALGLGLLWAMVGAGLLGLTLIQSMGFIVLSLLVVSLSIVGDLFESLLKREAGAKDSGQWLPGHGGLLDRIDGLLAALPLFTLGLWWLVAR